MCASAAVCHEPPNFLPMKHLLAPLALLTALTSSAFAVPFTFLSGVYRYTRAGNGNISVEGGGLYSSGDYVASFTLTHPAADLAEQGLTAASLDAIEGKFVTGSDFIDSELATAEGRERLSNYSFSSARYPTDMGNVYLVTAGGFKPKEPLLNVSVTDDTIREGGKQTAIVLTLKKAATDELIVRYTLGGRAKLNDDYKGPAAERYVEIPKGRTTFRIPVRPVDDKTAEDTEKLIFELAKNDGYRIGTSKSVTIRIKDND